MTDLDNLKNQWKNISIDTPSTSMHGADDNMRDNAKAHSLTQRIIRRYRMMLIVVILGLLNSYPFMEVVNPPLWILIYYIIFIGLCGINLVSQMRRLELSDVVELPVVKAIRFTENFIRKRARMRNIQMFFGFIFVILLGIWLFNEHQLDSATTLIVGGLTGGIIGGILGYIVDTRFKRDLLDLKRFFGDFPDEEEIDNSENG